MIIFFDMIIPPWNALFSSSVHPFHQDPRTFMRTPTSLAAHSSLIWWYWLARKLLLWTVMMILIVSLDSIVYCDRQKYYNSNSLLIMLDRTNTSTVNFYVVHCVVAFQITISLLFLPVGSLLKRKTGLSIGKALAKCFL